MATIGLDSLYYAKITKGVNGYETYGTPKVLAKAMKADLTIEYVEGSLYADDVLDTSIKEFKSGKISLGVKEIGNAVAAELTGATIDTNGVLVDSGEDTAPEVAVGFRAKKANGKYRYFWLYRVQFAVPAVSLSTKGDSIAFATPTIEGTIMARVRPNNGKHPWKADVTEGQAGVVSTVIQHWFDTVYESGTNKTAVLASLEPTIGNELSPAFDPYVFGYTVSTSDLAFGFTFAADSSTATVEQKFNGETAAYGSLQTLEAGYNVYEITVSDGAAQNTYVVIVNYNA